MAKARSPPDLSLSAGIAGRTPAEDLRFIWDQHFCHLAWGQAQTSFKSNQLYLKINSEMHREPIERSEDMGDVMSVKTSEKP